MSLSPELEKRLMARAHARGLPLHNYLQELVAREADLPIGANTRTNQEQFDYFSDLLLNSPFPGADLNLKRFKDAGEDPKP